MDALGEIEGRPVVEIGPGRGVLTAILLERGARVLAVERDDRLVDYLAGRFADNPALELIPGDALQVDLTSLGRERGLPLPLAVVGNIPYSITSPLLRHLLAVPGELAHAVLMLQREVAERLLAAPGSRDYGSLTVGIRAVAEARPVLTVSPAKFKPPPKVWSMVVRIDPLADGLGAAERGRLERLAKTLFSGRRKQLQKVLRQEGLVDEADLSALREVLGVPLTVRPEELGVDGFVKLLAFLDR